MNMRAKFLFGAFFFAGVE